MNQYLATHDSALNTSLSKQKYTIPRAKRVPLHNKSECSETSYRLPQSLGTRMAGIGYGSKHDFSKDVQKIPAPNLYEIPSFVENNLDKKKGQPFACGRDQMQLHGIWGSLNLISPGPARYDSTKNSTDKKFTFGLKPDSLKKFNNPGPGTYESIQLTNDRGNQYISKFRSSGAAIIGKDQDRFKTLQSIIQHYNLGIFLNQQLMMLETQEQLDKDFVLKMVLNHLFRIHFQKPQEKDLLIQEHQVLDLEIIKCILNLNEFSSISKQKKIIYLSAGCFFYPILKSQSIEA